MNELQLNIISSEIQYYLGAKEHNKKVQHATIDIGEIETHISNLIMILTGKEFYIDDEFDTLDYSAPKEIFQEDVKTILLSLFP